MAPPDRAEPSPPSDIELTRLREEAALADLGRLASMARRRWRWLLFLPLALCLLAGLRTTFQERRYEATATLVLHATAIADLDDERSTDLTDRGLKTEANLLNGDALQLVLEAELGDDLSYSAEPVVGTELLTVTAEATTAQRAAELANGVAETYLGYRSTLIRNEIQRQVTVLSASAEQLDERLAGVTSPSGTGQAEAELITAQRAALQSTIDELVREAALADGGARVAAEAVVPREPVAPNPTRSIALALILGLLLAATAGWLRERADKRLRSMEDLEGFSGRLECLGLVGRPRLFDGPGPVVLTEEPLAEQFRVLASNLAQRDNRSYVIQLTGIRGREGSSYVAANMATTLAVGGWNTVVVDADLNNGQLHRVFGVGSRPGLKQLLGGEQLTATVQRSAVVSDLGVVATGSQGGSSVSVHGTGLALALERLAAHFDIVIIDGPPLLASGDASILAHHVDKTVLVAALGHSDRSDVADAVVALRSAGGQLSGIIVTETTVLSSLSRRLGTITLDHRPARPGRPRRVG